MWVVTDWITYFIVLLDMWPFINLTPLFLDTLFVFRFLVSLSRLSLCFSISICLLSYTRFVSSFFVTLPSVYYNPSPRRPSPPIRPLIVLGRIGRPGRRAAAFYTPLFPAIYECCTYKPPFTTSLFSRIRRLPCIAPWSPQVSSLCHMSRFALCLPFSLLLDVTVPVDWGFWRPLRLISSSSWPLAIHTYTWLSRRTGFTLQSTHLSFLLHFACFYVYPPKNRN